VTGAEGDNNGEACAEEEDWTIWPTTITEEKTLLNIKIDRGERERERERERTFKKMNEDQLREKVWDMYRDKSCMLFFPWKLKMMR
jgi:hypothetical protein